MPNYYATSADFVASRPYFRRKCGKMGKKTRQARFALALPSVRAFYLLVIEGLVPSDRRLVAIPP
jgi:hypothetical protein